MYWVINALIAAYERLAVNVIPFFAELKAVLYFSLLFDGPIKTTWLFNKIVKPYFLRYENVLDKHLANLPADARKFLENAKSSDAVYKLVTMSKEQADKLIEEHGAEIMEKMMTVARMQASREFEEKAKETISNLTKETRQSKKD